MLLINLIKFVESGLRLASLSMDGSELISTDVFVLFLLYNLRNSAEDVSDKTLQVQLDAQ